MSFNCVCHINGHMVYLSSFLTHTPSTDTDTVLNTVGAWDSLAFTQPKSICLLTVIDKGFKKSSQRLQLGSRSPKPQRNTSPGTHAHADAPGESLIATNLIYSGANSANCLTAGSWSPTLELKKSLLSGPSF